MSGENGNTDRLLGKLIERTEGFDRRLSEVQLNVVSLRTDLNTRLTKLEQTEIEKRAASRTLMMVGGAFATVFGAIGGILAKMWGNY